MLPSFHLRNLFQIVECRHARPVQSAPSHRPGDARAMPPQPETSGDTRIAEWAAANGHVGSPAGFSARLNGRQVASELLEIFRETPEFGRSLAFRIAPFLDERSSGSLRLIAGGGEAAVFGDEEGQQVVKLFGPPGKAGFGWVVGQDLEGRWHLRAGSLTEALMRFHWFEDCFPSGLELDQIGDQGQFLALRQPFILGHHPEERLLHDLTWHRGDFIATDVRSENALVSRSRRRTDAHRLHSRSDAGGGGSSVAFWVMAPGSWMIGWLQHGRKLCPRRLEPVIDLESKSSIHSDEESLPSLGTQRDVVWSEGGKVQIRVE